LGELSVGCEEESCAMKEWYTGEVEGADTRIPYTTLSSMQRCTNLDVDEYCSHLQYKFPPHVMSIGSLPTLCWYNLAGIP